MVNQLSEFRSKKQKDGKIIRYPFSKSSKRYQKSFADESVDVQEYDDGGFHFAGRTNEKNYEADTSKFQSKTVGNIDKNEKQKQGNTKWIANVYINGQLVKSEVFDGDDKGLDKAKSSVKVYLVKQGFSPEDIPI